MYKPGPPELTMTGSLTTPHYSTQGGVAAYNHATSHPEISGTHPASWWLTAAAKWVPFGRTRSGLRPGRHSTRSSTTNKSFSRCVYCGCGGAASCMMERPSHTCAEARATSTAAAAPARSHGGVPDRDGADVSLILAARKRAVQPRLLREVLQPWLRVTGRSGGCPTGRATLHTGM